MNWTAKLFWLFWGLFQLVWCLGDCFLVFVVQTPRNIYKESCLEVSKMFGLFGHKKRIEKLRTEVQDSFNHVKKDFNKVGEWIKHLDDKHSSHEGEISSIKNQLMTIHEDLMELKDFVSFFGPQISKGLSKQTQTSVVKQPLRGAVQTLVQTGVQTDVLENLTVMERAIVWALLNSEMRLSYEDLAALLGKDKSTIRGQINAIKQKSEGLIEESREVNGKKRLYIPDEIRTMVVKGVKVKIKGSNKGQKE
ncbi:MAG: hypothetical protein KKF50_04375 [Nanoarchaeota archaeon]|nr:hypothetical protein [Nanoarchaeota archaeon]